MSIAAAAAGAHGSWAGRGGGAQTGGRESGRAAAAAAIGRRGLGGARVLAADGKRERDETPTRRGRVCGWTKGRCLLFCLGRKEEEGGFTSSTLGFCDIYYGL